MLFYRFEENDDSKEETKKIIKKKTKKSKKNVFKVEDVQNNSSIHQNEKGNTGLNNENGKNCQKICIQNDNKITNNIKKDENSPKDYIKNKNSSIKNVEKVEKHNVDYNMNKNKILKNNDNCGKHKDSSGKITKANKKGIKRKMDYSKNGSNEKKKFSNKKYKTNKGGPSNLESMSDDRLKAYGINPKKFRNKLKYGVNHQ